jgi:hypothetical protein
VVPLLFVVSFVFVLLLLVLLHGAYTVTPLTSPGH